MPNQNSKITKELDERKKEIEELLVYGFSASEVAKKLGYGYAGVYNAIIRNGLKHLIGVNKNGKSNSSREYYENIQKFSKEVLYKEYHEEKLNLYEMAERHNMTPSGILYNMKKLGIETRDASTASRLMHDKNPELAELRRQYAYAGVIGIHRKGPRKNTWIEKKFEEYCMDNNLEFKKQFQIDGKGHRYDFIVGSNLIVEVDGEYWHNSPKQKILDDRHEKLAKDKGFSIIRFTDVEIRKTKGGCFEQVRQYV